MQKETLERNRCAVLERIRRAARAAGRSPDAVRLVAVTKTVEPEVAAQLVALGTPDLGENRVPELERKHAWFEARGLRARWHFIGHVQRNKARRVVQLADEIHSLDSPRLLATLARIYDELGRRPGVWLQVHLSGESAKSGLSAAELPEVLDAAARLAVPVLGLMTMAPLAGHEDPEHTARPVFARLAELARGLPGERFEDGRPRLSMGMSGDFELAIAEGADVVRVGSALYDASPEREGSA